jgi:hypothetical protein
MRINWSVLLLFLLIFTSCSKKEEKETPSLHISPQAIIFDNAKEGEISAAKEIKLHAKFLSKNTEVSASENFEVSLNTSLFSQKLTLSPADLAAERIIYVRLNAESLSAGKQEGELKFSSPEYAEQKVSLSAELAEVPKPTVFFEPADGLTGFLCEQNSISESKSFKVSGKLLSGTISLKASEMFQISTDNSKFYSGISLDGATLNSNSKTIYVRFKPDTDYFGAKTGKISAEGSGAKTAEMSLSATAQEVKVFSYQTFNQQRLAFGGGYEQASTQIFNLHEDVSKVSKVLMYVKLRCPIVGCNAWDVFANILVKAPNGEFWEIGRFITPYGIDNSKLANGFVIDVTDFKSLLQNKTELKAYIETWGSDGWLLSVNFEFFEGIPEFPYSSVSRVIQFNKNSLEGVPYGEDASAFDLTKNITLPANAEKSHLRTIITGWGHAGPNDSDGRPCAEWCYRTHFVKIDGNNRFEHALNPIGCGKNKVSGQFGNWQPDRAGWCPGMEVPLRIDNFEANEAGKALNFDYYFTPWTNNNSNGRAFYAISTFVVTQSKTPISPAVVGE